METKSEIIRRHRDKIIADLQVANCPEVYCASVFSNYSWLASDVTDSDDIERVFNRHIARTLTDLENVDAPYAYVNAVKQDMRAARQEVEAMEGCAV